MKLDGVTIDNVRMGMYVRPGTQSLSERGFLALPTIFTRLGCFRAVCAQTLDFELVWDFAGLDSGASSSLVGSSGQERDLFQRNHRKRWEMIEMN